MMENTNSMFEITAGSPSLSLTPAAGLASHSDTSSLLCCPLDRLVPREHFFFHLFSFLSILIKILTNTVTVLA